MSAAPSKKSKILTNREKECLLHSAQGHTAVKISELLEIDHNTVVFHLTNACRKLGAANRTEAVAIAITHGLIQTAQKGGSRPG